MAGTRVYDPKGDQTHEAADLLDEDLSTLGCGLGT
jgi:hypothetical protein